MSSSPEDRLRNAVEALIKGTKDGQPVSIRVELYDAVSKAARDVMLMGSFPQPPSKTQSAPPPPAESEDPSAQWWQ